MKEATDIETKKKKDLEIQTKSHMEVLVTYNFWDPRNRGYWFQGKVEKVRPTLSTIPS